MVSCGGGIVKILLGVFNLLWLILGAGIVYIGVRLVLWHNEFNEAADIAKIDLGMVSWIILLIGVVIVLIAFLGFCGACCQNTILLNTYAAIILIIIVAEIVGLVFAIRNNEDIEGKVNEAITKAIKEINSEYHTAYLLEMMQYKLKCCGWQGPSDYGTAAGIPAGLPGSCCGQKPTVTDGANAKCPAGGTVQSDGCKAKIHFDSIVNLFKGSIGMCIAVIIFQLVLILAACCLSREIRAKHY